MLEKVNFIISEYQGISKEEIHMESHLVNDLGFTSFDVAELVGQFEEAFNVEIPDRKIKLMKTVGDIVKYIESKENEDE